jgi:hypothetical protein
MGIEMKNLGACWKTRASNRILRDNPTKKFSEIITLNDRLGQN